jgi:hypothetical protein
VIDTMRGMFRTDPGKAADQVSAALVANDPDAYEKALGKLQAAARRAKPAQNQAALVKLLPILERIPAGMGGDLAQLAGGLADLGTDPAVVAPVLVPRASVILELAAQFREQYNAAHGDVPSPEFHPAIPGVLERFAGDRDLVEAWFTANEWAQPVLFLAQRKDFRQALNLGDRARLTAAAREVGDDVDAAGWLHGILRVLDDEPLIVLHRATGRAFRVTISGIGDNFQLHTLLAAALLGGPPGLPGDRPSAVEIAAATDGDPEPTSGIRGNVNLADHTGEWIWNEGRPADIPLLGDTRVVVIDPAPYPRTWNAGRAYPLMRPEVTVTGELPADEAAGWAGRVKPPQR